MHKPQSSIRTMRPVLLQPQKNVVEATSVPDTDENETSRAVKGRGRGGSRGGRRDSSAASKRKAPLLLTTNQQVPTTNVSDEDEVEPPNKISREDLSHKLESNSQRSLNRVLARTPDSAMILAPDYSTKLKSRVGPFSGENIVSMPEAKKPSITNTLVNVPLLVHDSPHTVFDDQAKVISCSVAQTRAAPSNDSTTVIEMIGLMGESIESTSKLRRFIVHDDSGHESSLECVYYQMDKELPSSLGLSGRPWRLVGRMWQPSAKGVFQCYSARSARHEEWQAWKKRAYI